jgi:hypothetical protein
MKLWLFVSKLTIERISDFTFEGLLANMDHRELYFEMHEEKIMLTFKGDITGELVQAIMNSLERRLALVEDNLPVRKRLYSILLECLQNIVHHQADATSNACSAQAGLLLVTSERDGYSVRTGNKISNDKISALRKWLDKLNSLSTEQLRTFYKETLNNREFSEKGTAGLGFIYMTQKTGQRLNYSFEKMSGGCSLFSFNIFVPRKHTSLTVTQV